MTAPTARLSAGIALSALLLAPASATATTYIWQMSCTEDQVNNSGVGDGSTDSTATGSAHIRLDTLTGRLSWDLQWNGLEGDLSAIHIHGPADELSSNSAHIFNVYTGEADVIAAGVDRTSDRIYGFDELIDLIVDSGGAHNEVNSQTFMVDEMAYTNIHSTLWPMGEIRCHYVLVSTLTGQEQTKEQQKCTNTMRKDARKVTSAVAKGISSCIKRSAKSGPIDFPACFTEVGAPKRDKAAAKLAADFVDRCGNGAGPLYPTFGVTDGSGPSVFMESAADLLAEEVFDPDLSTAIAGPGAVADCQRGGWDGLRKCQDALLKDYATCTKKDLAGKAGLTTVEEYGMEKCFGSDRKGKVAKACAPTDSKLRKALDKKCGGVDLTMAFPGCGLAGTVDTITCMDQKSRCEACLAVNGADDIFVSCDYVDDGVVNSSCVP